jgi:2-keto-4-pentenoate hydratase
LAITLWHEGEQIATGSGREIPGGDPVAAVVALANAQPLPAPLTAGQIVTTGTCTPPLPVQAGLYRAAFAGLGEITVRFTD